MIIEADVIRVGFSSSLDTGQEIPVSFFSLDGVPLTEEDQVVRSGETTIELHLRSPLYYTGPPPVLSVSQYIRSAVGENLLDPYDKELTIPAGIADEELKGVRQKPVPLPCYPNPFNGSTTVSFEIPWEGETDVTVQAFDLRGRLVKVLLEETVSKGVHSVAWDGRDERGELCPSGIYFLNITAGLSSSRLKITHQK